MYQETPRFSRPTFSLELSHCGYFPPLSTDRDTPLLFFLLYLFFFFPDGHFLIIHCRLMAHSFEGPQTPAAGPLRQPVPQCRTRVLAAAPVLTWS